MKLKAIARSAYITTSVLFVGAFVALSNPGILHGDGPDDLPDYLSGGKLEYTSRVDLTVAKDEVQIETLYVSAVEAYDVSEATDERLQELIGEWGSHLLRLEGGEDLYDSDGRPVVNDDGTEGLTVGSIQELRDEAKSQKDQAEENLAQAEDSRAKAEEARMNAELAKTRDNAAFYLDAAEIYDDHADILESDAEILCGSADGLNAQADALEADAEQTKKNIADALSELAARGVDVSGLSGDGAAEGGATGTDADNPDDISVDEERDAFLGTDDDMDDSDGSEFDPPDDDDVDSDLSVVDDSSADTVTDSPSTDGDATDTPKGSKTIPAGAIGVDANGDWIFDFPPPCGNYEMCREGTWDWNRGNNAGVVTDSSSTDGDAADEGDSDEDDDPYDLWSFMKDWSPQGGYTYADNSDSDGDAADDSDSDEDVDPTPVKATLPGLGDDAVNTDESNNTDSDIPGPVSTLTPDESVSVNTSNGEVGDDVVVNASNKIVKDASGVERASGEGNILPGPRQVPGAPNTVLDSKLKALAAKVTGPQDDDDNFLVPWVWEDIVVSPQVIEGLLLIRDMHVVHLESLAVKLDNTVALPRADKIRIVRALRDISVDELRPAFVNFVSAQSQVARYPFKNGRRGSSAEDDYNLFMSSKDPAIREYAEDHVWAVFLRRRAEFYKLLGQNPVLGIEVDGVYFYDALRKMPASASDLPYYSELDQDYIEVFNKYLKTGTADALEQAAEAAALTQLDDLWDFGSPRFTRAQNDAVALTRGLGATIGSELIDAVRLQFKAAEMSSEFEAGVVNVSLGILAAIAFPIPGIGPFISAGIAISLAGAEGARYGMAFADELEANKTAAVTGYDKVIAAEDATSAAGDRFQMAAVFAAFELGSLQAARILGQAKGTAKVAGVGDDIARAADDVADGARGLSRADADHWISTVPEGLRGGFIAKELTELDKVVLGAQKAGLTEADIAPVLARLRQNSATLSFEAIEAVERELMVTIARERGLTVMVHPDSMLDFLRFAGNADLSHVRPMNLVELADIRIKALLERSGKPQFWTQAEIDMVNQVIRPAGDDAARWVSFEALQGLDPADVGLRQIFTVDDLKAIDEVFDGRNLNVAPSTGSATGSGTQYFPMEMPGPGPALDTDILRIEVPGAETVILPPRFEIKPLSGTAPRVETVVIPRPSSGG